MLSGPRATEGHIFFCCNVPSIFLNITTGEASSAPSLIVPLPHLPRPKLQGRHESVGLVVPGQPVIQVHQKGDCLFKLSHPTADKGGIPSGFGLFKLDDNGLRFSK